jgi:hypothetical protein
MLTVPKVQVLVCRSGSISRNVRARGIFEAISGLLLTVNVYENDTHETLNFYETKEVIGPRGGTVSSLSTAFPTRVASATSKIATRGQGSQCGRGVPDPMRSTVSVPNPSCRALLSPSSFTTKSGPDFMRGDSGTTLHSGTSGTRLFWEVKL